MINRRRRQPFRAYSVLRSQATDYSTYLKLLRVTAYTCRFIDNCRRQVASRVTSSLTTIEIHDAEKRWLKSCQATQFQDEIANMQTNSRNSRLPLVKQLRLYLDSDGIISCGGRIHNAPLGYAAKFPYLLPKKHELTKLIVFDAHENQLHSGVNSTITQLRQKYWITVHPAVRQIVIAYMCEMYQSNWQIVPYTRPATPTKSQSGRSSAFQRYWC